ncbi:autotransporter outer membrane beta-barrel domain-containing protein, partial [Anaerobiospirillum succiniciproducens]|uniref:autotransporter outer membrane beta-barrel domain-containing protein n=1 Tax=Anaerobiospirillum succiniciproducens TaxID=13335 RepID=UPI0029425A3B
AEAVTLNDSGSMTVEAAAVDAGTMTVGQSGNMLVTAGAVVTADTLNGATNAVINVGQDGVENGTASLFAGTLNLKSGTLFVDPEYGEHYAAVTVTNFSSQGSTQTDDKSAGLVDGKIKIGKNAALGVGFESKAELDAILANYVGADGSFYKSSSKGLANALVLNKAITLGATDGIYVAADAVGTTTVTDKNVTIKDGAGLIITDNVFTTDSVTGKKTGTAITVDQTGSINVTDAQLKLIGNFTGADKGLQIFSDTTTAISGTMTIKSANGLLKGELDATTGKMDLNFDRDAAVKAGAFADASEPVRNMLLDQLDGKLAYSKAIGYQLIADAATASLSGAAVDAAAHAATYAGAQQAAVLSVTTMADAMFGRVGAVGVEAASISATGSQANGGVWLTPMYKSMDSDGFNAQGASYGSDVDAAGVAFGADTVNGNMRFGAVFNIGSGDADGKGNGSGLKDEFDYYGLGIYSAMGFGNFALVGDASLTVISHDVEGHGFKGKADTTAVTMGVTGQYTVATPSVDVTPHLGARFIRLNTDSYDLISAKGVEATTDFDVQNVFSVPLGVTLSKGFVAGGWTLAPSADLSVTFNTGDTDAKSTTTFTGVKALNLNTEVLDEVQYGVTLGLGAQNGAFGTSFGINYTGSSNTDSFGVNAQARYMF